MIRGEGGLGATLALVLVLGAGCGDDGSTPPPDGGRDVVGAVEIVERRTIFVAEDQPPTESRSAVVTAHFADRRPPRWHHEVARAGACVLARYTPALCTPACGVDACVATDVCEPWPTVAVAGPLTVAGLAVALRLPGTDGFYYPVDPLPEELFADDAAITADLAGGDGYPALHLATTGVPALEPALPAGKLTLLPGHDATVRWTPVAGASRVRLTLNSNNQGHGAPYLGIITCDVDDAAGEVTIAAALVDGFPGTVAWSVCAGSDCPPSTLRRYHRAVVAVGAHDVELVVASEVAFGVDHVFLPD